MHRWCSIEDGAPLVLPAPLTDRSSLELPDFRKMGCTPNGKHAQLHAGRLRSGSTEVQ